MCIHRLRKQSGRNSHQIVNRGLARAGRIQREDARAAVGNVICHKLSRLM